MTNFTLCTSCHKHMATLSGKCYRCHRTEQMKRVTRRHESGDGSRQARGHSMPMEFHPGDAFDRLICLDTLRGQGVDWTEEGGIIFWHEDQAGTV